MKFGIELECYGVQRDSVVGALRNAGLNAVSATYAGRSYDVWQVKYDGSIRGDDGFELVSPVLEGEAGINEARRAVEVLRLLGAKVNDSCGFHVHHDARGWGIRQFRNLFKRFVKHEAALDSIMEKNRRGNINQYIKSLVRNCDATDVSVQQHAFDRIDECRTVQALSRLFGECRYFKLNLQCFFRTGTVEFRHHHGTVNADVVERYIRLTAGMVQQAVEHRAVRAFPKQVTTEYSLELMLWTMRKQGALSKEWADAVAQRAKSVARREAAHA